MRILVWGTGFAARDLCENELKSVKIAGFIDNKGGGFCEWGEAVIYHPTEVKNIPHDCIIVATGYAAEIYEQAKKLNLDIDKFVFVYNNYLFEDINRNYDLAAKVFSDRYVSIIKSRYHVIRGMHCDENQEEQFEVGSCRHDGMYHDDYVRLRTFELCVQEIKSNGIKGNVAEFGVFQGDFAKYINRAFYDRVLYLFDTFEGFEEQEATREKEKGHAGDAFVERFKNTSVGTVIKKMEWPESVVIKKGLFPESLEGLDDTFAFVSIDVDFELSIYEGLTYFYPRLEKGGYLFVHDYNSATLKGVRNAVTEYEKKIGQRLSKLPVCDLEGTMVITR